MTGIRRKKTTHLLKRYRPLSQFHFLSIHHRPIILVLIIIFKPRPRSTRPYRSKRSLPTRKRKRRALHRRPEYTGILRYPKGGKVADDFTDFMW